MNDSSSRHVFTVLCLSLGMLILLSSLPWGDLTGNKIKDFNIFEDLFPENKEIKITEETTTDPELENLLSEIENLQSNSSVNQPDNTPTAARDSAINSKTTKSENAPRKDGHVAIENYTGAQSLSKFKQALSESDQRLVRIAFLGDSFIEGDIFTQDLRHILQEKYGGCGVGYMNLHSDFPGFRKTIRQGGSGWDTHDIRNLRKSDSIRTLSGEYAKSTPGAKTTFKGTPQYSTTKSWERSTILFLCHDSAQIIIDGKDARSFSYSPQVQALTIEGIQKQLEIETDSHNITALGVYLDGKTGIQVDCMSVRGNSGISLRNINAELNRQMSKWIDYDLIVLEYGINALNAEENDYTAYGFAITKAIEKIKQTYPNADILLMGIADRGAKAGTEVRSLPTCAAMVNTQRNVAKKTGVHFYDTREAMGGESSVVEWRKRGFVNADYIHLNHAGGREMANEFATALNIALNE